MKPLTIKSERPLNDSPFYSREFVLECPVDGCEGTQTITSIDQITFYEIMEGRHPARCERH
jgi:hypothetical protein